MSLGGLDLQQHKNETKKTKGEGCKGFVDICFNGRKMEVWITKGFVKSVKIRTNEFCG